MWHRGSARLALGTWPPGHRPRVPARCCDGATPRPGLWGGCRAEAPVTATRLSQGGTQELLQLDPAWRWQDRPCARVPLHSGQILSLTRRHLPSCTSSPAPSVSQILAEPQIAVLCVCPQHSLLPRGAHRDPSSPFRMQAPLILLRAGTPSPHPRGVWRPPEDSQVRGEAEQRPELNPSGPAWLLYPVKSPTPGCLPGFLPPPLTPTVLTPLL